MSFNQQIQQPVNQTLAARLKIVIWVLTVIVFVLVGAMRRIKIQLPDGVDLSFLPAVHACLNTCVAVLLLIALVLIKRKNILGHKIAINSAMVCSILFLTCYVAYHFTNEETSFGGEGMLKYVYYFFLATHVILAAVSFPFILVTWMYGATNQFSKHRSLAKWVFPVWLYVAVTGPICYLLLRPYY